MNNYASPPSPLSFDSESLSFLWFRLVTPFWAHHKANASGSLSTPSIGDCISARYSLCMVKEACAQMVAAGAVMRVMTPRRNVRCEEARHLLELSREARWSFPSSFGAPVSPGASAWIGRIVPEQDSFFDAVRFLMENGDEGEAVEMAAHVWRLWVISRDLAGGRAFLATVLDLGERKVSRARALALYGDGLLALRQGKLEESRQRNQAALDVARSVKDPEALTLAYLGLSRVAYEDGEYERARSLSAQALQFSRSLEPSMRQAPLHIQAQATRLLGDYNQAATLFRESLDLNSRLGDQGMVGVELHNLGHVEVHRGNIDAAEHHFAKCKELESADDPYSAAMSDLDEAVVAFARGDYNGSRSILSSSQSILKQASINLARDDQFEMDWLGERLVSTFGSSNSHS